jgi:hypothetical protein
MEHGRIGHTRTHAVDRDALARNLLRHACCQGSDSRLGGAIGAMVRDWLMGQLRGGIDDAPIAPRDHVREDVLHPEGDALQVEVENPVPTSQS